MISATRREALLGALAIPAVAGVPRIERNVPTVVVLDPTLAASRRIAAAYDGQIVTIEGDAIRLARALFERRPWLVVGVSRPADALLIEEVGREAGYALVSEGTEALRELIETPPRDSGLVLGWVLAPR